MKKTLSIIIFSFLFFFCFFLNVKALTLDYNFDFCTSGDAVNVCSNDWTTNQYFPASVSDSEYSSIPNSLKTSYGTSQGLAYFSFSSLSDFYLSFNLKGDATLLSSYPANLSFRIYNNEFYCTNPNTLICDDLDSSSFNFIEIKRLNDLLYFKCNGSDWSDSVETTSSTISSFSFDSYLTSYSGYFDDIFFSSEIFSSNLNIDFPLDGQYLSVGKEFISGSCLVNGIDELYLTYQDINPDNYLSYFNCDCVNNTFNCETSIYSGNREIYIYDKEGNSDVIQYTGINENFDYKLTLDFPIPDADGNTFTNLAVSNEYNFRFGYTLPDWSFASTTKFYLSQCDSNYSNCSSLIDNTLSVVDPDQYGYVDSDDIEVVKDEYRYYHVGLADLNDIVLYNINFRVYGKENGVPSTDPDTENYSWLELLLRKAFVPKPSTLHLYTNELPSLIQTKIPFVYFYYIKDKFDSMSISTTTIPAVIIPLKVGNTSTITMPIVDFSETTSSSFLDDVRPFIIALLWFGFGLWLIHRITELNI